MSFLEKIRDLFRKEEPEQVSIDKAIDLIKIDTKNRENNILERAYENSLRIQPLIKDLIKLLEEFEKKEVIEDRAIASKNVKDKFCSFSIKELSSLTEPRKETREIELFLDRIENSLNNLGKLTQRQTMHLRFFFPDDFRTVSRKVTEINNIIKEIKEIMLPLQKYKEFENLQESTTQLNDKKEARIKEKQNTEKKIQELKTRSRELTGRMDEINNDLSMLNDLKKDLEDSKNKIKFLEQEIDSYISIEKLLKKFEYKTKTRDPIISAYIQSPSKAILSDKDLRILAVIEDALKLNKKEKIADDKKIERAEKILKNKDYLKEKRDILLSLIKEAESKAIELEKKTRPVTEKTNKLKNEKSAIDQEVDQQCKKAENINQNIADLEKEIEIKTRELHALVEELSPNPIKS